ncbi:MAG: YncE family protein, partial [Thermoplasmata archaeon]|nr:YncE family protein [Thermoplasmata archaeon]
HGNVYVGNFGSYNLTVIHGLKVVRTISLRGPPNIATLDPAKGWMYVGEWGKTGRSGAVTVINDTRILASISLNGTPVSMVYDSFNGFVYVGSSNNVTVINGTAVVVTLPQAIPGAYDASNGFVYAPDYAGGNVSIINGTKVVSSVKVFARPTARCTVYDRSNGWIYVASVSATLYGPAIINVLNGTRLIANFTISARPDWCEFDPVSGFVYIATHLVPWIYVINGTRASVATGSVNGPEWLTVSPADGYVYVSDTAGATVTLFNGTKSIGSVAVGSGPSLAAYDSHDGYLYVPDQSSNNVTVLVDRPSFRVTFTERGLPPGTVWSVTLCGVGQSSVSDAIGFLEPNGTCAFTVGSVPSHTSRTPPGAVTVAGHRKAIPVRFH